MRRVLFSVVLSLASPAAAVKADNVPEPFRSLAGAWQRPDFGATLAQDEPAGRFLEQYNISGRWQRTPQTYEDLKAR